ncbi:MAG TPA: hypothetical protein VGB15_20800 [Longimicrobium sp.]|jgi:hypothetical protein
MTDPSGGGGAHPRVPGAAVPADRFAVRITVTRESHAELMRRFDLDLGCRPRMQVNADGTGTLLAYADERRIGELVAAGYALDRGENVSALGRERQREIGVGDRFQGGRIAPRGLGRKSGPGQDGRAAR